jgi:hypothetical protein
MPWCIRLLPLPIHWYPSNREERGRKERGREEIIKSEIKESSAYVPS